MRNPLNLSGDRVLVTGAASGIGRAVAVLLAELSAKVLCVDLDERGLEDTLGLLDGSCHALHVCDLCDVEAISAWVKRFAGEWGPLSGMVHAAGTPCIAPVRGLTPGFYRKSLTVNVEAGLALARAFQSRSVNRSDGGSIVFISSVMGIVGSPGATAYSLGKAAVIGMTRSMALEFAPRNIRVNCVAPGFVRTPMYEVLSKAWTAEQAIEIEAAHPLGLGEPLDVAHAVAFLLAPTARWITGTVLSVDGGYTAR